ncbi:MAG: ATP-dependent DNA ligase [Actinomycetota bacterium]|nr:ATP-dependent DNA ligase [Actinomycetota bacterium]
MLLVELARTSAHVASSPRRLDKVAALAAILRAAPRPDVPAAVAYLSGDLRQRRTGLGWAALGELPPPAEGPTLTVAEVDETFGRIAALSGAGAGTGRRRLLHGLLARATPQEQRFLAALVSGELRQGALDAIVVEALAVAVSVPAPDVRRAVMLRGATAPVAQALLLEGASALAGFRLEVGRPVQPMVAQPAADVATALGRVSPAAVEDKLDGIRVQVHRRGDDVGVWTRTLDNVTGRLPEVVEAVLALPATCVVLDGEAIALRPDGRPRPFQATAARVGSRVDVDSARRSTPLSVLFFDLLHLDGQDLLAVPAAQRHAVLAATAPGDALVGRMVTDDVARAEEAFRQALARGHEGVVVKSLDAPYDAGRRGGSWLKVKPRHTLDLVVLAAEWGHGRRSGWLSNLHLGAPDPATGALVMLGKTFKGLTDEMLRWQTERLSRLAVERPRWGVVVRPELVVEVAFDGVQTSPRYSGGMALRFARVLRHRPDKPATEADTVDAVRAVHADQP